MVYLKLFFPSLSSTNNAIQLIYSHSALTSVCCLFDEQYWLAMQQISKQKTSKYNNKSLRRHKLMNLIPSVPLIRQKVHNLGFVTDMESTDFWSSEEDTDQFAHALQLEKDDYHFNDIETVQSESCSIRSRKWSCQSETESLICESEVMAPS